MQEKKNLSEEEKLKRIEELKTQIASKMKDSNCEQEEIQNLFDEYLSLN